MNEKIEKLEAIVSDLENKNGYVYFFVFDTKNAPNGELKYIYDIAKEVQDKGYNVRMLHQEDEFVGPLEWLGDYYNTLEHIDVRKENLAVTPADYLFIPEVCTNVMGQVKNLPCRKIMVYYNSTYLNDYMPVGVSLMDYNIHDAITTNSNLQVKLKSYFPNVNVRIVRPSIRGYFKTDNEPKKLIVNLLTPTPSEVNDIVKPFYWKNPAYKWLSFRDLKGAPQRVLGDMMKEAAITVWVDDNTNNAQMALEALKSGSILIAKVPQTTPEWMMDEDDWRFGIIWVDSYEMLHNTIASVVRGWTRNNILDQYLNMSDVVKNVFTKSSHVADIEKSIVKGVFDATLNTYKQILSAEKNNELKIEE
jgi:hypothetical protein